MQPGSWGGTQHPERISCLSPPGTRMWRARCDSASCYAEEESVEVIGEGQPAAWEGGSPTCDHPQDILACGGGQQKPWISSLFQPPDFALSHTCLLSTY